MLIETGSCQAITMHVCINMPKLITKYQIFLERKIHNFLLISDPMLPKVKRPHTYSIRIVLPHGEVLDLHNVDNSLKLSEVKVLIEHDLGIPTEVYRLSYLDKADLLSHCTLAQHEIVPRARVNLRPWKMWESVLALAFSGLISELDEAKLTGDDEQSKYKAFLALFIAAHRGHCRLVEKLLRLTNVDINTQTKTKWTALHAAARTNQWRCLCILIDKGADIMLTDNQGKTALDLTKLYGAKKCEQSLNFCSWNLQKYNQVDRWEKDFTPYKLRDLNMRLAHQTIDSSNPAWMKGNFQTRYLAVRDNAVSVKVHTVEPI